jgi:hypothetical protein
MKKLILSAITIVISLLINANNVYSQNFVNSHLGVLMDHFSKNGSKMTRGMTTDGSSRSYLFVGDENVTEIYFFNFNSNICSEYVIIYLNATPKEVEQYLHNNGFNRNVKNVYYDDKKMFSASVKTEGSKITVTIKNK